MKSSRLTPQQHVRVRSAVGAVLLACSGLATAGPSLCSHEEETFLSCQVANGRIVSLCGVLSEAPDAESWLQYRFGQPQHVELAYPSQRKGSLKKFKGESRRGAGVRLAAIEFSNQGVRYQVEDSYSSLTEKSFFGIHVIPARPAQSMDLYCQVSGSNSLRFEELADLLDPSPR